jgi:hypothetical protein
MLGHSNFIDLVYQEPMLAYKYPPGEHRYSTIGVVVTLSPRASNMIISEMLEPPGVLGLVPRANLSN